jgi:hypothetical protein
MSVGKKAPGQPGSMKTGDANARSFIAGHSYQLDVIGGVLIQTRQSDGLTWAKPDYQSKYLMDNCEAYRGLRDLASLFQNAFGDSAKAAYYNNAANSMQSGILGMWLNGTWAVYKNDIGGLAAPNMRTWYADASAQVFPALMGNSQDPFPWCLIGTAAAAMGDSARVSELYQYHPE